MAKKLPFVQRISERIKRKLAEKGIKAASEYGVAVLSANRQQAPKIIALIPPEVGVLLTEHFRVRDSIKLEVLNQAGIKFQTEQAIAAAMSEARMSELRMQLQSARAIGQGVSFLCGLPVADRNAIGTKEEIRAVIAAQKETLKTGAVREALQCTVTELNRWTLDGRLPYLFRRKIQSLSGTVEARFWRASDVEAAKKNCVDWREEDAKAKASRRKMLKPI